MHRQRSMNLNQYPTSGSPPAMFNHSRSSNVSLPKTFSSDNLVTGSNGVPRICQGPAVSSMSITQFINAAIQNDVNLINTYHQSLNMPVDVVDKNGYTALIYASRNGNVNVVRRLIELNANVDYQEPSTFSTALHYAAQCGHTRTAEVLINIGKANKEILNRCGKTPFDLAKDFGHGNNKIMKSLFFDTDRSLLTKDGMSSTSSIDSGLSQDHLTKSDVDINNNETLSQDFDNSFIKSGKINKFASKKNVTYLPNPMLLERFAQYGCYQLIGDGFGFSLLAKNGPTQQMIFEASLNLSIPINNIDGLLTALNKIVRELESNNKFTLKEYEAFDSDKPDPQRINNLFAYNVWLKDNTDKIIKMIAYLQQWKEYVSRSK